MGFISIYACLDFSIFKWEDIKSIVSIFQVVCKIYWVHFTNYSKKIRYKYI